MLNKSTCVLQLSALKPISGHSAIILAGDGHNNGTGARNRAHMAGQNMVTLASVLKI